MARLKLQADERLKTGTNTSKKIRREKEVPGILYSIGEENVSLKVSAQDLRKVYNEAGMTQIITLDMDGEESAAIIKDIQTHPVRGDYLHVDFQRIDMNRPIRVTVPIYLENRDSINPDRAIIVQVLNEIDVETLPANIPESLEIDVEGMEVGDSIFVEDLEVAKDEDKYTIFDELDTLVLHLVEPDEEIEEEEKLDEMVDAADVPTVDETEEPDDDEILDEEE